MLSQVVLQFRKLVLDRPHTTASSQLIFVTFSVEFWHTYTLFEKKTFPTALWGGMRQTEILGVWWKCHQWDDDSFIQSGAMNCFLQTLNISFNGKSTDLGKWSSVIKWFCFGYKNATSSNLAIYMPLVLLSVHKNTPNLAFPFCHSFHHHPCPSSFYFQHNASTKLKEV